MAAILNSAILHWTNLHIKKTSLIHSDSTWWWQPSWILPSWDWANLHIKNFTHSIWLNLMMAAILNSAMMDSDIASLDSDTLLSSLRFTEEHSYSTLTLTQTNSIWLKLIHSHLTWWWQQSWIQPSWNEHFGFSHLSFSSQSHSHLLRLVSTICTKKLHSLILTQHDDGSHLEFCHDGFRHCHLGFRHLVMFSQIHSKTLSLHSGTDSN